MRTERDAHRSIKRYVGEALDVLTGTQWQTVLWDDDGEYAYPFCRVEKLDTVGVAGPQPWVDMTVPFVLHLYPQPGARATETMERISQIEEALFQMFRVGYDDGYPLRIPLYDYEGVELANGSSVRNGRDYLRVVDLSWRRFYDPDDERQIAVVCDLRVNWRRTGRVLKGLPLQSVRVTIAE